MASCAFVGFAGVLYARSQFTTQTDFIHIMLPTLAQGAAMAFFFIPLTTITMSGLPPDRIAAAAGLSNFVRISAGAMGTSITTTLWESRAVLHHAHLAETLDRPDSPLAQTLAGLQASGLDATQALASIERMIDQQAYTRAADDIFLGSAYCFLVLIVTIWFSTRPGRLPSGAKPAADGAH
jgi:DHA2 family multidrug resistance protein